MAVGLPEVVYTSEGHKYLHLPGLIMTESDTGEVRYLLSDGLGSVRHVVDEAGVVVAYREYSPYGEPIGNSLFADSPYSFTGEWWESEVGLLHLRARWYDPGVGVFLSKDPFAGNALAPQSMHGFNYVNQNPINLIDPTGWMVQCLVNGFCPEINRYLCAVTPGAYDHRGIPCAVNPSSFTLQGPASSSIRPVTTLADMSASWWETSPVARPPEQIRLIIPIANPAPKPYRCEDCHPTIKYIRDNYLAPHSFYVQMSVEPEPGTPTPVEIGIEKDWVPAIVAINPVRVLENLANGFPVETDGGIKTFSSIGFEVTVSTPQIFSVEGEVILGHLNSEYLDYLAGSEICGTGYVAIDIFGYAGPIIGAGMPMQGDINNLLNGNPLNFYGDGFVFDRTTGQLVRTIEGGIVIGVNTAGNAVEGEVSFSPGLNYTYETEMSW